MKVAFLYPRYLTHDGGAELGLTRIVEELAKRGHEITVIAAKPLESQRRFERKSSAFRVVELARRPWIERALQSLAQLETRRGFYGLARFLIRNGLAWKKLLLLGVDAYCPGARRPGLYDPYDVVVNYSTTHTSWGVALHKTLGRLRGKAVCAVPLSHFHEQGEYADVFTDTHRVYDGIEAHTDFERDTLASRGLDSSRIFITGVGSDPYGPPVDPSAFRRNHEIPAGVPLVVFVGRKVYLKGVTHLIEAMDAVWAVHPDARLALLGFSHNPREWIEGCLAKSRQGAASKTVNLDDASEQTREEALAACDVFAMPSAGESFGIAYLDAWRYAKPVIACRGTCCESVVSDGVDGLLVGYENVGELSQAILRLLSSPREARAMGERGHGKWDRRYRWEHIAALTEKGFQELLDRKRGGKA